MKLPSYELESSRYRWMAAIMLRTILELGPVREIRVRQQSGPRAPASNQVLNRSVIR
jgi:hypothetical protein